MSMSSHLYSMRLWVICGLPLSILNQALTLCKSIPKKIPMFGCHWVLNSVCVVLFVLRRSADVTLPEQDCILYVCLHWLPTAGIQEEYSVTSASTAAADAHSGWGEYVYGFIVCLYILYKKASTNAHFEVIGHATKPQMKHFRCRWGCVLPEKYSSRYVNAAFIPILCI